MEGDDFLNQEQYIIDFPDEITNLIETDDTFEFDLIFDQNGKAGKLVTNKILSRQYLFRVFLLPCNTESYTSIDNDYFYKNADISELILVFDPQNPPLVLQDYEKLEETLIERAKRGLLPQEITFPHGLTPPTRWAALELQPNLYPIPKFQFEPSRNTMRMQEDKCNQTVETKKRLQTQIAEAQTRIKNYQLEKQNKQNQVQSIQNSGAQVEQSLIDEIQQIQVKIEEEQKQISQNEKRIQEIDQNKTTETTKTKRGRQSKSQVKIESKNDE